MENCPIVKCFYSILGVAKNSSATDIRTAYRKLAMRWHPDKCSNMKGDAEEQAKLKFQVVQEAYSVLSDKNKRVLYDAGLHDTDDDPCMQDFMAELVSLMKGACSASKAKSSRDGEFEKLSKLFEFEDIADTNNHVPERHQFHSNRASPNREQDSVNHQPFAAVPPPKPHPNLFTSVNCSKYDFPGNCDEGSRRVGGQFDQPATSCPKPHPNLYKEPLFSDTIVDHDASDSDFRDYFSTQDSVLQEPQQSRFTPEQHSFNPGPFSQTPTHFESAVSQQFTMGTPTTMGGLTAASSFNSEQFCMGASGGGQRRDYRGHGKTAKARRKPRCKERTPVVAPPVE